MVIWKERSSLLLLTIQSEKYDLDLLHSCANPALHKEISNFGYVGKNGR